MEVHHHSSHTEGSHHPATRNKWTHYFWEFIMLFLAVFCGFLAEYQLEHKIEKDRERQFIKSLRSDLETDIKSLDTVIKDEVEGIAALDTLIFLLSNPAAARQNGDQLYYTARTGPRSQP